MLIVPRRQKAYQEYAWVIIFVWGLLDVVAALIGLMGIPPNPPSAEGTTGLSLNQISANVPGISNYIGSISRQLGNFMLALGVLVMAIAVVPYRRGEQRAWYVSWILLVLVVIQLANSNFGYLWQLDLAFIFIILAAQFLPYRKFFPKKQHGFVDAQTG